MTQQYGIRVIDDSTAVAGEGSGVGITAVTTLKHAALYRAAKKMGGNRALAKHLGVLEADVGMWVNLKRCPPRYGGPYRGGIWNDERVLAVEEKLLRLTGLSWEELFPDELRDNLTFLNAPKQFERTTEASAVALTNYAEYTRERMLAHSQVETESRDSLRLEDISKAMPTLSPRERVVIAAMYGFNCAPMTLEQCGKLLKVSRERVRQIEAGAINKIKHYLVHNANWEEIR